MARNCPARIRETSTAAPGKMLSRSIPALYILTALLMIITVAVDYYLKKDRKPSTVYNTLLATTVLAGVGASLVVELLDIRITGA